jgi:hypothetical protein
LQASSCRLRALPPLISDLLAKWFVEEALSGSAHITSIHRLTGIREVEKDDEVVRWKLGSLKLHPSCSK